MTYLGSRGKHAALSRLGERALSRWCGVSKVELQAVGQLAAAKSLLPSSSST